MGTKRQPMEIIKSSKFALMKQLLILLLFIGNNSVFAQAKKEALVISTIRIDSLLVSIPQKTVLKAEIIRCSPKGKNQCKDCETDTSLIIKDAKNKVLLYRHGAYNLEEKTDYFAFSQKMPGIGNVLAIQEENYPTVASDQGSLDLYVLDKQGNLMSIVPSLSLSGDFGETGFLKVHRITKEGKFIQPSDSCKNCTWIIETKNFTGQCGFEIGKFYPISLDGSFKNTVSIPDSIPVYAGKNNQVQLKQVKNATSITLFEKPFENSASKKLILKSNTLVKFYMAKSKDDQMSILVSINGIKGYLRDLQELDKLGFPSCD
jgi:hypothetical protein